MNTIELDEVVLIKIVTAIKECERTRVQACTNLGLIRARAAGKTLGRPTVQNSNKKSRAAVMKAEGVKVTDIANRLGVSRATVYRMLELS